MPDPFPGTGTIHPRILRSNMLHPRTFCPHTLRPRTLFSDVFTSLHISSLNESQPTELHQPCIGWAFSLTYPNPEYGQSHPTELHQPMNWLGI